jgi:hypothetical protein
MLFADIVVNPLIFDYKESCTTIENLRGRIVKCKNHPTKEAITICPSCGRHICEICIVNVLNTLHCKECAERIIVQMALSKGVKPKSAKLPQPIGTPSRKYFVFGYIGSIIMATGAFILMILGLHRQMDFLSQQFWEILWPLGVSLFCIGLATTSIGFFGFYINYGSNLGYVCLLILPLSSLFFLAIFMYSFFVFYEVDRFSTGIFAISVALILMAISIIHVKFFTLIGGLSNLTSVSLFAAAGLIWLVFIPEAVGFGWLTLMAACVLMAMMFFRSNIPLKDSIHVHYPVPPSNNITIKNIRKFH